MKDPQGNTVYCAVCGKEAETTKPCMEGGAYSAVDLCRDCEAAYDIGFAIAVLEAAGLEIGK